MNSNQALTRPTAVSGHVDDVGATATNMQGAEQVVQRAKKFINYTRKEVKAPKYVSVSVQIGLYLCWSSRIHKFNSILLFQYLYKHLYFTFTQSYNIIKQKSRYSANCNNRRLD